jgi:membrane protease subunit HflK
MTHALRAIGTVVLVLYLATGITIIQPDEQGVVRRFGKVTPELLAPGLRFVLPWGLATVDRVKPAETKQVSVGVTALGDELLSGTSALRSSEFLTGDQNIIHVQATAQYRISDPEAYVFRAREGPALLASALEAMLAEAIATKKVDFVLTEGRAVVQNEAQQKTQALADRYRLGITIGSVNIGDAAPPLQVADAFLDVQNARSEREQIVHLAESKRRETVARAEGEARESVDRALAYRDRLAQHAEGESERFLALLEEYQKAKTVTAMRLYLETMEQVLPRLEAKLIVDPGESVDLSILRARE